MNSAIFTGAVGHQRLEPVAHRFSYPLYFLGLDLDELDSLDRTVGGFGYNRVRPVALHDRDYLEPTPLSLAAKARARLAGAAPDATLARIMLITTPRYWHYAFNPVSFYLGFDADDRLRAALAEVNNTFGDRHLYVLPALEPGAAAGEFCARRPKAFHVSPFNDLQGEYAFSFQCSPDAVRVGVDLRREGRTVFRSWLEGNGRPLTSGALWRTIGRHPVTAMLTMPRIVTQAARLHWRRKLPVFARPEPASPDTIIRRPPGRLERAATAQVLDLMGRLRHGSLTLRLPDGDARTFGTPGAEPSARIDVHRHRFFKRVLLGGDVGFGEAFVDGDAASPDLVAVLRTLIANREALADGALASAFAARLMDRARHLRRPNTRRFSRHNIQAHYDLNNRFFAAFLDPTMMYSCARFERPGEDLESAQQRKLQDLIGKARIAPHHHILEIGSGWGAFAIAAARATGCRVTSITVSEEQRRLAEERVRAAGLSDRVEIRFCDYRDLQGQYDRIVSIEMLEAVGHDFLGVYFKGCDRLLKPDGLVVLQVITIPDQRYDAYRRGCDWIQKHIFPGGHLPSLGAMTTALRRHTTLEVEHLENIVPHYVTTLQHWRANFERHWPEIAPLGFDDLFRRKWRYYLAYCEAAFATRTLNVLQLVLTRPGNADLPAPHPGPVMAETASP